MSESIDTNKYRICEDGSIIGVRYGKDIARTTVSKTGYYIVKVACKDGKLRTKLAHRVIAEHLIPNPNNLRTVNHINGNKLDNRVSNLEWMTTKDNCIHYTSSTDRWIENARSKLHEDSRFISIERDADRTFIFYDCRICNSIQKSRLDSSIVPRGLCNKCAKLKKKDSSARY